MFGLSNGGHYLAEFSPEALRRERGKVSWLAEGHGRDTPEASQSGYSGPDTPFDSYTN